jgi:hypothetical protein
MFMAKNRWFFCLLALSILLLVPSTLLASFSGYSRSFLPAEESVNGDNHVTFYEYLDLELSGADMKGFSFHFGGWGRVDLADDTFGESTNGEFQYGYLNYRYGKANAVARLGRVYVSEGVAAFESVDGLQLSSDLVHGFSVALYGGSPVETDEDGRDGDFIYGGRLAQGKAGLYEVGLSYLKQDNDNDDFREEFGVDLFFRPHPFVTLTGHSFYNDLQSDWMEHAYYLVLSPAKGWTLTGEASWTDYGSYFQSPGLSSFAFPLLDPDEQLLLLGGELEWTFMPGFSVAVNYRNFDYDIAANADSYGAGLKWAGKTAFAGLFYRRMDGSTDELQYSEYRGYVKKQFGGFDVTFDALDVVYDQRINDVKDAYALVLALGYNFNDRLRLSADGEYGKNPIFDEEFKGMLKLFWSFSTDLGRKGGGS